MEWHSILIGPLSLALGVLLLLVCLAGFLWLTGKLEGYDPVNELLQRDNPALGLRYALFAIAVVFSLLGIFNRGQGDSGAADFAIHAIWAALLIYISRFLNDWFILYHFSNNHEVVQEKNLAVALIEGATYMASAYVIGAAFYDWESGLTTAILWFVIGQLLMVLLAFLYRIVARGTDRALDDQNLAVGISLSAFLLAGGMVCGTVISGPSTGWRQDLLIVAAYLGVWVITMLAAHAISDRLVFRSSSMRDEVGEQRNIAAALFKAVLFISLTLAYTHG